MVDACVSDAPADAAALLLEPVVGQVVEHSINALAPVIMCQPALTRLYVIFAWVENRCAALRCRIVRRRARLAGK